MSAMHPFWDMVTTAAVALNIIGGVILVRWLVRTIGAMQRNITALEGTVRAQEQTLQAVGQINKTVLEVFQTLDPKRWATEVEVHKQFADERAAATIERAQRQREQEKAKFAKETVAEMRGMILTFGPYVKLASEFLAYVPKNQRLIAIEQAGLDDESKAAMLRQAEETPELRHSLLDTLAALAPPGTALVNVTQHVPLLPPPPMPPGLRTSRE
jgi:hypothetical protein